MARPAAARPTSCHRPMGSRSTTAASTTVTAGYSDASTATTESSPSWVARKYDVAAAPLRSPATRASPMSLAHGSAGSGPQRAGGQRDADEHDDGGDLPCHDRPQAGDVARGVETDEQQPEARTRQQAVEHVRIDAARRGRGDVPRIERVCCRGRRGQVRVRRSGHEPDRRQRDRDAQPHRRGRTIANEDADEDGQDRGAERAEGRDDCHPAAAQAAEQHHPAERAAQATSRAPGQSDAVEAKGRRGDGRDEGHGGRRQGHEQRDRQVVQPPGRETAEEVAEPVGEGGREGEDGRQDHAVRVARSSQAAPRIGSADQLRPKAALTCGW